MTYGNDNCMLLSAKDPFHLPSFLRSKPSSQLSFARELSSTPPALLMNAADLACSTLSSQGIKMVDKVQKFYPAEDVKKPLRRKIVRNPTKLR